MIPNRLWGKPRSDLETGVIVLFAALGSRPNTMGYVWDLAYYQGGKSIWKAERLARNMSPESGNTLIELVRDSNARIEQEWQKKSNAAEI